MARAKKQCFKRRIEINEKIILKTMSAEEKKFKEAENKLLWSLIQLELAVEKERSKQNMNK
jgi:hypothetical protein